MKRKRKAVFVRIFAVLTLLIIISMIILGFNLFKNRWHRLDFSISSINAVETDGSDSGAKYRVCVKGTAKTWFYDFNTYEFDLSYLKKDEIKLSNPTSSKKITVNHSGSNEFEFEFELENLNDFENVIYSAEHIYVDGYPKEGTDIKLFMRDYKDLLTVN